MHNQVIFINRVLNPNKPSTISRNKTYLNYICTKNTVASNSETTHGLFGKVDAIPDITTNENSVAEVQKYIKQLSQDKKNIYRSIISLKEIDAVEKGYLEREKWEDLIRAKLPDFASEIGIKYENLEYVASVHLDKGHPHCHIMFWDKNQEVQKNWVSPYLCDKFRAELNKYIFSEEYMSLLKEKDVIKDDWKKEEMEIIKELSDEINPSKITEYMKSIDVGFCDERIFKEKLDDKVIDELTDMIFDLRKELPENRQIKLSIFTKRC